MGQSSAGQTIHVLMIEDDADDALLTSSALTEMGRRRFSSYITKPVTFEGLVDVMRTLGCYWFEIVELPAKKPHPVHQPLAAGNGK